MRRPSWRAALGILVLLGIAPLSPARAQQHTTTASSPAGATEPLTLKERLGAKWTDEQRVDNCKVPPDKRGPKARPDTCPNTPIGLSSKQP